MTKRPSLAALQMRALSVTIFITFSRNSCVICFHFSVDNKEISEICHCSNNNGRTIIKLVVIFLLFAQRIINFLINCLTISFYYHNKLLRHRMLYDKIRWYVLHDCYHKTVITLIENKCRTR